MTKAGFVHAFSTRAAGNLSLDHGEAEQGRKNRAKFLESVGQPWRIVTLKQTHSHTILSAEGAADSDSGDALVSSSPHLFLGVKTADCVPVLIGDPVTKTMAAVHAGWRGTFSRIVEKTVEMLTNQCDVFADDLIAAIGPAACGRCYEVGDDVADSFRNEFADVRAFLLPSTNAGKFLLNVPAANATQLIRLKVRAENVHVLPYCTMHQSDLFFSHRMDSASNSAVGRQLSIIGRV